MSIDKKTVGETDTNVVCHDLSNKKRPWREEHDRQDVNSIT